MTQPNSEINSAPLAEDMQKSDACIKTENNVCRIISTVVSDLRKELEVIGGMPEYGDREAGKKITSVRTLRELKKQIHPSEHKDYGLDFDILQAAFPPYRLCKDVFIPYTDVADFYIAGTPYYGAVDYIPRLSLGGSCTLQSEPDNKCDRFAIAVFGEDGTKLGYVPREKNREAGLFVECGAPCCAAISKYSVGKSDNEVYARIELHVEFLCTDRALAPDYPQKRNFVPQYVIESRNNRYAADRGGER
jgi:hypothetical protein